MQRHLFDGNKMVKCFKQPDQGTPMHMLSSAVNSSNMSIKDLATHIFSFNFACDPSFELWADINAHRQMI